MTNHRHRQIFSTPLLLCLYYHPVPLVYIFSLHADRLPAERLTLILSLSLSEKLPSPHNSQREKMQVGDTITLNCFFRHSALPQASLALFTVAYKVLILPLLTVGYEDSVCQRWALDFARHEIRFSIFFLTTLIPQETLGWSLLNWDNLSKWKRRICHFHCAINPWTLDRVKTVSSL